LYIKIVIQIKELYIYIYISGVEFADYLCIKFISYNKKGMVKALSFLKGLINCRINPDSRESQFPTKKSGIY